MLSPGSGDCTRRCLRKGVISEPCRTGLVKCVIHVDHGPFFSESTRTINDSSMHEVQWTGLKQAMYAAYLCVLAPYLCMHEISFRIHELSNATECMNNVKCIVCSHQQILLSVRKSENRGRENRSVPCVIGAEMSLSRMTNWHLTVPLGLHTTLCSRACHDSTGYTLLGGGGSTPSTPKNGSGKTWVHTQCTRRMRVLGIISMVFAPRS